MREPVLLIKKKNKEYFNVWGTEYPRHKSISIQQDARATAKFAARLGYITDAQALEAYASSVK